ncbi:class II aaRS and biotin synthetase [Massarina eburnea CBS 473.64]|uniref:threonine--tRNA ligase n=1 Tax=Massarina eburnea CBS 473.64 TaxID=1395130 RepID=A0A6A6RTH0_9PLEO|nr:class II aaRS and biotin synthetase [Massarina eburnea CBS 473.64]
MSMSRLPLLSSAFHTAKRIQLRSVRNRAHGQAFIRACSCSAPQPPPLSVVKEVEADAQLNPTTSEPPTPPTDHRSIASIHHLFITSPFSPGSPLLLPNGAYVFQRLQAFLRAQYPQFGYQEVITPTIYKKSLWEKSGHWENYAKDMFSVHGRGLSVQKKDAGMGLNDVFGLKPMNCPGHCLLFKEKTFSYRDLPVRFADFSALHRNEISGALTGLTRVRRFHQDDAHIFCRPDQILSEIESTLTFVGMVYDTFALGPYKLLLSTRPKDRFIGTVEEWDRAEQQLTQALNNSGREWATNDGDGAFYGPKIDIILKDANGKEHQTATIQLDFQLPQRFGLSYPGSPQELESSPPVEGMHAGERRPVIIHRAIYGSLERFMALLIEHYVGIYPFWLSPCPAIILPITTSPSALEYASHVQSVLTGLPPPPPSSDTSPTKPTPQPLSTTHLPISIDKSDRSLQKKIFEARTKKYNHVIVIGNREMEEKCIRLHLMNLQNEEKTVEVLEEVLGRKLGDGDRSRGGVSVEMGVQDARRFYEELVNRYL